MIAHLHGLSIALRSDDARVLAQWRQLFDYEILLPGSGADKPPIDITIQVQIVPDPPHPPALDPFYIAQFPPIKVYASQQDGVILRPSTHVTIQLNLGPTTAGQADINIQLTPYIMESDGFEDVITLGLSPFLRRRGLFMVHAFSAAWENRAVMFVGPSGCGKTSSGLSLTASGWHLLANDIALLNENSQINALLSPGTVHATPATLEMIPALSQRINDHTPHPAHGKVAVPRLDLLNMPDPQPSAALTTIYFPQIGEQEEHTLQDLFPAVGLARMMEASIDQWDKPTWIEHVDFLDRLSHQVTYRTLTLGRNLSTLPALIEKDNRR